MWKCKSKEVGKDQESSAIKYQDTIWESEKKQDITYKRVKREALPSRWLLLDFSLTVKAAPHECTIRTSQP